MFPGYRTAHRDPFDRMLVAQAWVEPMRLTADNRQASGAIRSETVLLVSSRPDSTAVLVTRVHTKEA